MSNSNKHLKPLVLFLNLVVIHLKVTLLVKRKLKGEKTKNDLKKVLLKTLFSLGSASESVKGPSLSLECVDNIESGDSLPLGVLGVGDGVTDNVLEESPEDLAGLFVDLVGDSLDSSTTRKAADGGLGDAHDGLLDRLLVGDALGSNLSVSFSDFASSWGHLTYIYY